MSTEIAAAQAQLPAHLQNVDLAGAINELAGGVTSGFPVIGYKGKVWSVRKGGETQMHVNAEGEAIGSIEVVLLRSNDKLSKTFYEGGYTEGDQAKPDCWSSNGISPDTGVPHKRAPLCEGCPNNVWGSKTTEQGKSTKACADLRRAAVCMAGQLEEVAAGTRELKDVDVLLLRVPAASLNPLKDYAERVLKPKGIPPFVLVTKISFDPEAAFPKFLFKGSRFLNEPEFNAANELRESDEAKRVLNESSEHNDAAGTTAETGQVAGAQAPPPAEAQVPPTPAASPKPAKAPPPQPVAEPPPVDIAPPPPAPPTAVETEQAAAAVETVDDIAPAPPPTVVDPAVTPEVAPAPPVAVEPVAAAPAPPQDATSPAEGEDFDAMLNSILG